MSLEIRTQDINYVSQSDKDSIGPLVCVSFLSRVQRDSTSHFVNQSSSLGLLVRWIVDPWLHLNVNLVYVTV